VEIAGRVQGVGFRESCRREARRLGVAGTVRNRADGMVEAVFEGPGPVVEAMVDWCRRGPRAARVRSVAVSAEPPARLDGFTIGFSARDGAGSRSGADRVP
jgi:acylphosphatase